MVGGLMSLVAYGAQDMYLNSNSKFTYFKTEYSEEYSIEGYTSSKPINLHIDDNSVKVWCNGYYEVVSRSEYESMQLQNDDIMINHDDYSEVLSRSEYILMKSSVEVY